MVSFFLKWIRILKVQFTAQDSATHDVSALLTLARLTGTAPREGGMIIMPTLQVRRLRFVWLEGCRIGTQV